MRAVAKELIRVNVSLLPYEAYNMRWLLGVSDTSSISDCIRQGLIDYEKTAEDTIAGKRLFIHPLNGDPIDVIAAIESPMRLPVKRNVILYPQTMDRINDLRRRPGAKNKSVILHRGLFHSQLIHEHQARKSVFAIHDTDGRKISGITYYGIGRNLPEPPDATQIAIATQQIIIPKEKINPKRTAVTQKHDMILKWSRLAGSIFNDARHGRGDDIEDLLADIQDSAVRENLATIEAGSKVSPKIVADAIDEFCRLYDLKTSEPDRYKKLTALQRKLRKASLTAE